MFTSTATLAATFLLALSTLLSLVNAQTGCNIACSGFTSALSNCSSTVQNVNTPGAAMNNAGITCMCQTDTNYPEVAACLACSNNGNGVSGSSQPALDAWFVTCKTYSQKGNNSADALGCWGGLPNNLSACAWGSPNAPTSSGALEAALSTYGETSTAGTATATAMVSMAAGTTTAGVAASTAAASSSQVTSTSAPAVGGNSLGAAPRNGGDSIFALLCFGMALALGFA